jgi:hypothetical protein
MTTPLLTATLLLTACVEPLGPGEKSDGNPLPSEPEDTGPVGQEQEVEELPDAPEPELEPLEPQAFVEVWGSDGFASFDARSVLWARMEIVELWGVDADMEGISLGGEAIVDQLQIRSDDLSCEDYSDLMASWEDVSIAVIDSLDDEGGITATTCDALNSLDPILESLAGQTGHSYVGATTEGSYPTNRPSPGPTYSLMSGVIRHTLQSCRSRVWDSDTCTFQQNDCGDTYERTSFEDGQISVDSIGDIIDGTLESDLQFGGGLVAKFSALDCDLGLSGPFVQY